MTLQDNVPTLARAPNRRPNMKILITGGGGFVGQILASRLLQDGHSIVLTDIFEPPAPCSTSPPSSLTCIKADLCNGPLTKILSPDLECVFILHGMMSSASEANLSDGYTVNLTSAMGLLEGIRRECQPGIRVVYASSTAVYGNAGTLPSETDLPTPKGSYGTQKAMVEMALDDYHRRGYVIAYTLRFPTVSVRPGKPSPAASAWMSGIVREPLQGLEAHLPCDDDFQAWICSPRILVENLVHTLTLARDCLDDGVGRRINLPGITVSVREMLQALEAVGGKEAVDLVKRVQATDEDKVLLESWPARLDDGRATKLGFVRDNNFHEVVAEFAKRLTKGG
ncbi:NAD(P)-binding protein [Piedraia hortae CBS 480.64]|uniref:NAD(P)-binding protein n=1 Tax=Piedraia hortae CBS 480.64 TaxID=1314780 RepID=A0A6A7BZI4_9PEZI|nr:NAD(P)-binding protein [Piedraia hortae CBS 480.64]